MSRPTAANSQVERKLLLVKSALPLSLADCNFSDLHLQMKPLSEAVCPLKQRHLQRCKSRKKKMAANFIAFIELGGNREVLRLMLMWCK